MSWIACLLWVAFPIADADLRDASDRPRSLREWNGRPILVVAFLGVECPVSRAYAGRLSELAARYDRRGVTIIGIDANPNDRAADVAHMASKLQIPFPVLRDARQILADRWNITRQPEVIVLDRARRLRYRGRVDDQFSPGSRRGKPTRDDLAIALDELLAGESVTVPETTPAGCPLERLNVASSEAGVAYHRDVAPILARRCVTCHRPGGIAPFSLATADDAIRKFRAIREAVEDRRMPPWHADPNYGKFANDPSLSDTERKTVLDWCAAGAPAGQPPQTPPATPPVHDRWQIQTPDLIVSIPQPFAVPATGVIPYQYFEVDPGFKEDRWIQEAEILPTNRAVVHHATVFLRPPGAPDLVAQGELQSFCLAAYAMGTPPLILPPNMAKKVPAGWRFVFVIHYVPGGKGQFDQTRLGLKFTAPGQVRKEVATNILMSDEMTIPARCPDHVETRSRKFDKDVLLLALFPHMHLRGVSFRYEATYPDGRNEILLSVPKWDMEWQHRYVFAEPKLLPAGAVLTAIGHYDNSEANPNNPDPSVDVHAGPQTSDEMFNGYYDYCLADQDLTKPPPAQFTKWGVWLFTLTLIGVWLVLRRRKIVKS